MKSVLIAAIALAVLLPLAAPAMAAGPDPDMLTEALGQRWRATQEALQAMMAERTMMQGMIGDQRTRIDGQAKQIADLTEKCGQPCAAQPEPAAPPAPQKP